MTELPQQPLPFSPAKQEALLGHMLSDEKFFLLARDLITPDLLVDPIAAKCWAAAREFAAKWGRPPTEHELRESSAITSMEQGARNKIYAKMIQCKDATGRFGLDVLRAELDDWLHGTIYRRSVEQSATLYNKGKFKEAFEEIRRGARDIDNVSFTETPEVDFSSSLAFLEQQQQDLHKAMTFGVSSMDRLLLPGGVNGSLLPGDMTVLLAPTNIGKCLGYDTPVIMWNGAIKPVQEVQVGDLLMGPDGKPRTVLSTTRGVGPLFKVTPKVGGESFVCNDVHVLSLKAAWGSRAGEVLNIPLNDFVNKSADFQRRHRLWRAQLEFCDTSLPDLPPYILGLWLGDGHSDRAALTSGDSELVAAWVDWVKGLGDDVSIHNGEKTAPVYMAVASNDKRCSSSSCVLRGLELIDNKHIPMSYKTASREQRLELLAGLLDSDGYYAGDANPNFEITQKNKKLAADIAYVARSLGFKVSQEPVTKQDQNGTAGEYQRLCIFGRLSQIPTRLSRKKAVDGKKNPLTTGFSVEPLGEGEYYGFTLDGDHLFLLGDFTVTHNTTSMITVARHNILRGKSVLFLSHEGRPSDITEKIWRSMLRVTSTDLFGLQHTPEGQQRLQAATKYLSRFLTYLPIHRPSLTVEELEGVIRRLNEKRKAKYGKGYDLVVDDYPAKLTSQMASKGNMQRRQKDEYVYDYLNRLASEMGFHCLAAIQGNREASKVNRREAGREDRLLTPEDVAESFGAMMVATNVITINRDPKAVADGRVTYFIGKSRSSETGWAVVCRSDYRRSMTHGDELGSTWYRGHSTMADNVEQLLVENNGRAIPEHLWGMA